MLSLGSGRTSDFTPVAGLDAVPGACAVPNLWPGRGTKGTDTDFMCGDFYHGDFYI